jgi:hypothetical protein
MKDLIRKSIFPVILFFSMIVQPNGAKGQVIISEYLEGASNDKCIELFNTTNAAINLTGYSLRRYTNGSTSATSISLTGTIPACGTYVICNSSSQAALLALADQTSGSISHNGDDAYDLFDGTTVLDVFGDIGCDPGSQWSSGANSTQNNGLIRNSNICTGVSDPTGACNSGSFTTLGSEWTATGSTSDFSDLGSHTSSCCGSSNTITTGLVTGAPWSVDCTTSDAGTVAFTSSGTFNAGNVYTVQLSDATGSFASPTAIGTLTSTANLGTINVTIPAGTPPGTGYRVRVVSDDPATTGTDNGSDLTITDAGGACECPHMTAWLINACEGSCSEGDNEMLFMNSGDYAIPVNTTNIDVTYGSTNPPTTTYTDNIISDATIITDMDAAAGCPGLFVDANAAGTIPANSSFIVVDDDICASAAFDFSALCGSGPIYVVISADASWSASGNFANSPGADRFLETDFSNVASGCDIIYSYDGGDVGSGNGDYTTYTSSGGAPASSGNDGCTISTTVLPDILGELKVTYTRNSSNYIHWQSYSEELASHYTLERSIDGVSYTEFDLIQAHGNSLVTINYSTYDTEIWIQPNYYRLKMFDYNNNLIESRIATVSYHNDLPFYTYSENGQISFGGNTSDIRNVQLFDASGKLIANGSVENMSELNLSVGVYILSFQMKDEKVLSDKVAIH